LKAWPILGISIVQAFLCLAHWFLYSTWIDFWGPLSPTATHQLRIAFILLSFLFMVATLLSFRVANWFVALLYKIASLWMGLLNFLFWAACLAWLLDLALRVILPGKTHMLARPWLAGSLLILAIALMVCGLLNTRIVRLRRLSIKLANLPSVWVGRTALIVSDVHLGNINGVRFARRIANMARQLNPDVIFIPGDLFDGTKVNADKIAAPLYELAPPLGVYFVTGNHEEFGGSKQYCEALRRAGFHVLDDECAEVDGVVIAGVGYRTSTHLIQLRHVLTNFNLQESAPSILLQHVPNRLPMIEQTGASLLFSGHTHCGQVFPFTLIARRAFGEFTYGLHPFGGLQVYTSSGAGTWGPPIRVGTHSEIVLITFE
jgi:uncharacterized protein